MPSKPNVFIAGVGFSPLPSSDSQARNSAAVLVSAATKALLDAGVSYDSVSRGVTTAGSHGSEAFESFEKGAIDIDEAERGSELSTAFQHVRDGSNRCVLMDAIEESAAVAIVLISEAFLWSHLYLKESSVILREVDLSQSQSASKGLYGICQTVWALRGWSDTKEKAEKDGVMSYKDNRGRIIELKRADENSVPGWDDVKYRQDGKHRLGYNPAAETKEISQEDFDAVRGSGQQQEGSSQTRTRFDRRGGDRAALSRL